jgi:hypothetical protein
VFVLRKKALTLLSAVVATFAIAACSEKLESGTSCPLLCPQQAVTLRDTVIDAVLSDTTVSGLPPIGSETFLMLASHGDTLDARVILRFDSLPQSYTKASIDSTIVKIDTAQLVIPLVLADTANRPKVPVTIEAYNVDTTATDTVASILAPLFRPSRLIGSKTFAPDSLKDTIRVPISTDTVLDRVTKGTHLRIGLRVVSSQSVDLRVGTSQASLPVSLRLRPSVDTSVADVFVNLRSDTPKEQPFLSGSLADYSIVVKGLTATPATMLGVGGVPSRRTFMRFDVPSYIVDSTTVVRASLLLTQVPNRRLSPRESVYVYPLAILAGPAVTNIATALQFLGSTGTFGLDSLLLAPGDSGLRSFEIVGLVRTWRNQPTTVSPRTLALRSGAEGSLPGEIDFFSTRAPIGLRPKLRITYVPQTSYGLP